LNKSERLVEVYRAAGEAEGLVIKGLLESCGIPSLLRSDAVHSVHMFVMDGLGQVSVMVLEGMAAQARELIESSSDLNDQFASPGGE
jgi:hypothetical protein